MAAQDIEQDLAGWIRDEIAKVCFGEDYGYAISWAPVPAQGPAGMVAVPAWQVLITCANPLLGQGDLYHMVPVEKLGFIRPREADVRREVADGSGSCGSWRSRRFPGRPASRSRPCPADAGTPRGVVEGLPVRASRSSGREVGGAGLRRGPCAAHLHPDQRGRSPGQRGLDPAGRHGHPPGCHHGHARGDEPRHRDLHRDVQHDRGRAPHRGVGVRGRDLPGRLRRRIRRLVPDLHERTFDGRRQGHLVDRPEQHHL